MKKDKISLLIDLALDVNDSPFARDDAIMELGNYNDKRALLALIRIAKNPIDDPCVLGTCGESIARLWVVQEKFDKATYDQLTKEARDGVYFVVETKRPDWIHLL